MPADPFRPDHLEEVLGGRTAPRTDAEREALRYSQLLPRLTPRGPSTGATRQMRGRFEAFLERGGRPRGFAGLLPPWLATPAMQRLAAGAVLLVGLGAGSAATGYTPADAARDAGNATEIVVNVVRNLNPARGTASDGGETAGDASPTPGAETPEPTASATEVVEGAGTPGASATPDGTPPATPISTTAAGLQTFGALEAGTVTLRRAGVLLEVVSTQPASGWDVEIVEGVGEDIEVRFESGTTTVKFKADVEKGLIDPEVKRETHSDDADDDSGGGGS